MKQYAKILSAVAVAAVLSACGNLSKVSDEGTTTSPVFPELTRSSSFNSEGTQVGSWPEWDSVRLIKKGMNKDQIANLIGRPHFFEGFYGVREWDYAFNFLDNGKHKICQFKVLFDKKGEAQQFFWYPNGCNSQPTFKLSSDSLFDFDQANLTPQGQKSVDDIAQQLKASIVQSVKASGYTDRLGSDAYNLDLSQRRAHAVKTRLVQQGVTAQIDAVGYGKANPVKACDNEVGQALIACLEPNRRVEIEAHAGQIDMIPKAGKTGPSVLYHPHSSR